jgi:4-amino-4-deoxy-L-arabinose transferase-like glycosyltransferase
MELPAQHKDSKASLIWLLDLIFISLFFGALYTLFLGNFPLIPPDEARYSEISREMLLHKNFITPMVNGIPFLDKPPLFYWMQCFFIAIFGLSEWSLRAWPATVGVLGTLLAYIAGRTLYNRRTGYLCAILLGTGIFYFAMSHYANMDLTVAFFISATLLCFYNATYNREKPSAPRLYLAYTFSALAILSKGLMGLALPGLVILLYIGFSHQWRLLLKLRIPTGFLLILIIIAPWFYSVSQANPGFWHYYIVVQQIQRFLMPSFNDHQPFYFYALVVIVGFTPWLFHLIAAFCHACKRKTNNPDPHKLFLLCWFIPIFIFFSIPASKLVGYSLSMFFPLAFMTASYINQHWDNIYKTRGFKRANNAISIFCIILAIAALVLTQIKHPAMIVNLNMLIWIFFGVFTLASCSLSLAYKQKCALHLVFVLTTLAVALNIVVIYGVSHFHRSLRIPSSIALTHTLTDLYKPGDIVVSYHAYFQDIPIYLHKPVYLVYNFRNPNIQKSDNWKREFSAGLTQKKYQSRVWSTQKLIGQWNKPVRIFAYLDTNTLPSFQKTMPSAVYNLDQYQGVSLVSNQS